MRRPSLVKSRLPRQDGPAKVWSPCPWSPGGNDAGCRGGRQEIRRPNTPNDPRKCGPLGAGTPTRDSGRRWCSAQFEGQANPNSARTGEGTTTVCELPPGHPTMADPKPITLHEVPESRAKPYPPWTESS